MADRTIGIGMIGCGTVGSGVARLLEDMADVYAQRTGVRFALRRILVRDTDKPDRPEHVPATMLTGNADEFFATPGMSVAVEVAGTVGMFDFVKRALEMGKPVVTANKSLLAAHGPELFAVARGHDAAIAFEASCGGGIPIITALKFGLMANRIDALYGILNGTCNYILTEMTQKGKDYATALAEAQAAGFAEADPTMDVAGRDAAEKLAILASLAFGVKATGDHVICRGIDHLDQADIRLGAELGYDIKLIAVAERVPNGDDPNDDNHPRLSLRVRPCFIHSGQLLAAVHGSFNALLVRGHATGYTMYYGHGAGQMPTASAVVSDLLNVVSGWYPEAFSQLNIWPDRQHRPALVGEDDLVSRFYLRLTALDAPGVMAAITRVIGQAGISISAVLQHESAVGQLVPLVVVTHAARRGAIMEARRRIEQLDPIKGQCVCLPILDLPAE